jgi:hypothetical protein
MSKPTTTSKSSGAKKSVSQGKSVAQGKNVTQGKSASEAKSAALGKNVTQTKNATQGTRAVAKTARPVGRYQPGRSRHKDSRVAATFEGHRVDRPVILGIGRNLSAVQRTKLQRKLYLIFAGVAAAAIVGVFAFGIINVNIIQPNLPIVNVNGVNISQNNYRMMVAYLAQDTWNKLQAANNEVDQINTQLVSEKDPTKRAALQSRLTIEQTTVSSLQTAFSQTQIDQLAINDLVEDQLIQQQTPGYIHSDPKAKAALTVTTSQLNAAFTAFKNAFPNGQSLSDFESKNNMSDGDVKNMLLVVLRRNAMNTYQQSLVVSPALQVHFQRIQFESISQAQADLATLKKDGTQWDALAKKDSLDVTTRDNGGDMGWQARGQLDQGLEQWLFDPSRKVGQMSGVIKEISGTFDILRIIGIDPHRAIDSSTLQGLQSNALSHWLTGLRNLAPTNNISSINQDMYNSASNVPQTPNINVTFAPTATPVSPTGP